MADTSNWKYFERPKQAAKLTGENMEYVMNKVTFYVAQENVKQVLPLAPGDKILETCCGHGVITQNIIEQHKTKDVEIWASDLSPSMVAHTTAMVKGFGWEDRVHIELMSMEDLSYPSNMFTHSFNYFMIFAVPNPEIVAAEMYRTVAPGGRGFIANWEDDGNDWAILEAHKKTRPADSMHFKLNPKRLAHKDPASLVGVMERHGFENVTSVPVESVCVIPDVKKYAYLLWSLLGFTILGWLPTDEANWDEAVAIVEASLRASPTFKSDGGIGGTITALANVATGHKTKPSPEKV